jgi:quercetin dioxygenase-like cupin family protein
MRLSHAQFTTFLSCLFACGLALAETEKLTVVPDEERDVAGQLGVDGPAETRGIESIKVLGTIPLDLDLAASEGLVLRVREITLLPGGTVGVHQHKGRPGVAYMLEGEMVEHRKGEDQPVLKGVGDVALEKSGTVHGWTNESDKPSRVVVVDIVPAED